MNFFNATTSAAGRIKNSFHYLIFNIIISSDAVGLYIYSGNDFQRVN